MSTRTCSALTAAFSLVALASPGLAAVTVHLDNDTVGNPFRRTASNGQAGFGGIATDPGYNGGTDATLTFSDPLTGVVVTAPTSPDFTSAVTSLFGSEASGFGVGNTNLGRFDRGEAFTLHTTHALTLDSFVFHEWHGDEDLHISWVEGGVAQSAVFGMTGEPGSVLSNATVLLSGVTADANSSLVITNASPGTANTTGRLRFRKMTVSLVPEPASLALLAAGGLMLLGRSRRGA